MTPDSPPASNWPDAVAAFLAQNLPCHPDHDGWQDQSLTAFQFGCEALIALGHATPTNWGAAPCVPPVQPTALPRWDDICVAVLRLANQLNMISYRALDGSCAGPYVSNRQNNAPPAPNIQSAHGLGPAYAQAHLLSILGVLGLVTGGRWGSASETVFWRQKPREWNIDFTSDQRFTNALGLAVSTMPSDVKSQIARLAHIDQDDINNLVLEHAQREEEMRERFGAKAALGVEMTPERALKSLAFSRINKVDWLFFDRWRLDGGWLSETDTARALGIFHDPLAMLMRRHCLAQMFPDSPLVSQGA